mgnify:CR=1 FL=1
MNTARLILNGNEHELPVVVGTENEVGIDITSLRSQTGAVSYTHLTLPTIYPV